MTMSNKNTSNSNSNSNSNTNKKKIFNRIVHKVHGNANSLEPNSLTPTANNDTKSDGEESFAPLPHQEHSPNNSDTKDSINSNSSTVSITSNSSTTTKEQFILDRTSNGTASKDNKDKEDSRNDEEMTAAKKDVEKPETAATNPKTAGRSLQTCHTLT